MDGLFAGGRVGLVLAALTTAGAADKVLSTELTILNVPMSMLLVAVAGTLFGFALLPNKEAARLTLADQGWVACVKYLVLALSPLLVIVAGYAFCAAWAVQLLAGVVHATSSVSVEQSVTIPATGLAGIGIRPWLPALLKAVERRASRVIGGGE